MELVGKDCKLWIASKRSFSFIGKGNLCISELSLQANLHALYSSFEVVFLRQIDSIEIGRLSCEKNSKSCDLACFGNWLFEFFSSRCNCTSKPNPTSSPWSGLLVYASCVNPLCIGWAAAVLHLAPPSPPIIPAVKAHPSATVSQELLNGSKKAL